MLRETRDDFADKKITIEDIVLNTLVEEFANEYKSGNLSSHEQIEYLEFINIIFKLKHKFVLDYRLVRVHRKRNMHLFYLKKMQRKAKFKIKKVYTPSTKELNNKDEVKYLKKLIKLITGKDNINEVSERTQKLLKELFRNKWSIKDKAKMLKVMLKTEKVVSFEKMLDTDEKEELVASFAALLGMMKNEEVEVVQERNFGEIVIKRIRDK